MSNKPKKSVSSGKPVDVYDLFLHAEHFNASISVLDGFTKNPKFIYLIIPRDTLAAFTVELYLKSIIFLQTGEKIEGHLLAKLFEKISPSNKSLILTCYEEVATSSLDLIHIRALVQPPRTSQEEIDYILTDYNNAFIGNRYAYEPDNALANAPRGPYTIFVLLAAIRKAVLILKPEWDKPLALSPKVLYGLVMYPPDEAWLKTIPKTVECIIYSIRCPKCSTAMILQLNFKEGIPRQKPDNIIFPSSDYIKCISCPVEIGLEQLRKRFELQVGKPIIGETEKES